MSTIRILHAADLHLDSAFENLSAVKATFRRQEQRDLLSRLAGLAEEHSPDLVFLSGDLFDSFSAYYETGEALLSCLRRIQAPVFITPGNHDFYGPSSPYTRLVFPSNVRIFTQPKIEYFTIGANIRVFGAAFCDRTCPPLLKDFHAPRENGVLNLMCLHADLMDPSSGYCPVSPADIAQSGMDFIAFGHNHTPSGLCREGNTWYSIAGCPEGRGFDETGDRFVNLIDLDADSCRTRQLSIAGRRYESLNVDISETEPALAIAAALPDETAQDIYRITLTGQTAQAPDLSSLHRSLDPLFFDLQLRDRTVVAEDLWKSAGSDTLKGLFLSKLLELKQNCRTEAELARIEQAARWGIAALENREEVCSHEN